LYSDGPAKGRAVGGQPNVRSSYKARAAPPLRFAPFTDSIWSPAMLAERAADRLAIDGKIRCRSTDGDDCIVLRWRRQVDEAAPSQPARWVPEGTAVFTLLDASAVIQISGSALQVVSTGAVLQVVDDLDDAVDLPLPVVWASPAAGERARPAAAMN
jgi:hypothetical protein